MSPKTVENHLGRTYGKLGISSRRELSGALSLRPERRSPGPSNFRDFLDRLMRVRTRSRVGLSQAVGDPRLRRLALFPGALHKGVSRAAGSHSSTSDHASDRTRAAYTTRPSQAASGGRP